MRSVSGFTLIEVVIGIVLIVAVSLAALEFYVHCQRLIVQPKLNLIAANFARETMEGLYWRSYENLNNTTTPTLDPLPTGYEAGNEPGNDFALLRDRYGGTRTYSITSSSGGYKVITVKVSWAR